LLIFFESPYLIYALYYSDRFLQQLSQSKEGLDIAEIIVGRIAPMITPAMRERYVAALENKTKGFSKKELQNYALPLESFKYGRGRNRPDAIDLFIKEGAKVRAMRGGVVLLAERDWKSGDFFQLLR